MPLRKARAAVLAKIRGPRSSHAGQSPFFHYQSRFDAEAIMRAYAVAAQPRPGYLVNFLDVAINPRFFPDILAGREGQVEGIPIPANWHADIAEWAAALRAVDFARGSFTMAELGCGWGCWINNTGVAAKRKGLRVHLTGVEGDEGHVAFAREACAVNGFTQDEVTLHRGIAAPTQGTALFPRQSGGEWGLEPVFNATPAQRAEAVAEGTHDELPMIPMSQIANLPLDLLHMDIQGGEAQLAEESIDLLNARVRYMVIGTHSRSIEGRLFDLLLSHGWRLEMERPAIISVAGDGPTTLVDGVQGWRNMALLP